MVNVGNIYSISIRKIIYLCSPTCTRPTLVTIHFSCATPGPSSAVATGASLSSCTNLPDASGQNRRSLHDHAQYRSSNFVRQHPYKYCKEIYFREKYDICFLTCVHSRVHEYISAPRQFDAATSNVVCSMAAAFVPGATLAVFFDYSHSLKRI